jgi:RNA polymerase sigma-70 factor, ECF subfamily
MDPNRQLIEQMLILRCQMGDNEAFVELIDQYGGALRYFINRLLDNDEITEDIYQDTWLAVMKKICGLRETDYFAGWLYHIARNKVYHHLRRKKLIRELNESIVTENHEDDGEFSVEDAAKVHKALEKLHPEHKEVLMLRFLEKMSYEQMTQVIKCNIGTVKSRIYYAKKALKKEMEK